MKTCRVTFSVYFLVLLTCMLALDSTGLTALALFCAAIHELGHFSVLLLFHVRVRAISFHMFGVDINADESRRLSYGKEAVLALAGVAANFQLCAVMLICWRLHFWMGPAQAIFTVSLFLALFNLLPVGSLDGGRALEALLCAHATPQMATRILQICSVSILLPAGTFGFWLLIHAQNVTLLAAAVYLTVSLIWHGGNTGKSSERRTAGVR
ncbi:site-2 protease family protein [Ethanoligenens harbinense]|uniref:Peptidase M50 n=1 Tax=Ethanoligenens harbinense (strain DSM 18485 / JCM 12961 / CGMCC 1.5033 / YUAN-3) TaxID=663278 RepID=E6U6X3_ETHHY|nr:site-2 protease family protein [Ethanoligenens harbinense]ADU26940.1 peptidase M50 [Ethanoligenens harbinense YUAN-3]AVQ96033.1 hypothetical protein CXQ68_07230 [Ethanoligenens harbinense YUAN-3]AYF38694.1 hypothetical protein CXP51_07100 [Ethanoligenens harbinense]AYF41441.1 hypothetical protein CN246_07240 [Ethanoligenens harbinense]QCN92275.1 hypothetical protein DRA42_07260 [Ethanoligenens harbinense]